MSQIPPVKRHSALTRNEVLIRATIKRNQPCDLLLCDSTYTIEEPSRTGKSCPDRKSSCGCRGWLGKEGKGNTSDGRDFGDFRVVLVI